MMIVLLVVMKVSSLDVMKDELRVVMKVVLKTGTMVALNEGYELGYIDGVSEG
jgi:hypothetical protein